jgi:hypothetical protein
MKRLFAVVLLMVAMGPGPAAAQCSKDTDCRGIRICEAGKCVADTSGSDDEPLPRSGRQKQMQRSPYQSSPASFCATNFGSCPMAVVIPRGSSCYCPTPYGPVGGVAR